MSCRAPRNDTQSDDEYEDQYTMCATDLLRLIQRELWKQPHRIHSTRNHSNSKIKRVYQLPTRLTISANDGSVYRPGE